MCRPSSPFTVKSILPWAPTKCRGWHVNPGSRHQLCDAGPTTRSTSCVRWRVHHYVLSWLHAVSNALSDDFDDVLNQSCTFTFWSSSWATSTFIRTWLITKDSQVLQQSTRQQIYSAGHLLNAFIARLDCPEHTTEVQPSGIHSYQITCSSRRPSSNSPCTVSQMKEFVNVVRVPSPTTS